MPATSVHHVALAELPRVRNFIERWGFAVPVTPHHYTPHRSHNDDYVSQLFMAMVHRKVNKKEIDAQPAAQEALNRERRKLEAIPVWDIKNPRPWQEVAEEAKKNGTKVYVGNLSKLVTQKHSELPDGHPSKVYKGRVVYRGDDIRDENWDLALFGDIASAPSSMVASKICDA